jgi:hypothetical protein
MKQYDNHFAVAVMICLKEIIFYISSYLNFRVGKYTIFLFSTVGRNIAANGSADLRSPEKEVCFRSWDLANLLVVRSPRSGAHKKRM